MENDVVSLPLARFAAGINEWGCHTVKRACLSVGVSLVLVRIQNLNLIPALQVNPAVASSLPLTLNFTGRRPFNVQLDIAEFLLGNNVACPIHLHYSVLDLPFRAATGSVFPLRRIPAIKEHHRIGGWASV